MPIAEKNSEQTDRIVASLRAQTDLIRHLMNEIETDSLSPQTLKHRLSEIETNARKLKNTL
jgi:hypothetical protein